MRNALAYAGKTQRRIVSAWVGTAFAQDDAGADMLAYVGLLVQYRAKQHSTNPLKCLDGEIKRRSDVVGIFPNEAAITHLIGALPGSQAIQWNATTTALAQPTWQTGCTPPFASGARARGSSHDSRFGMVAGMRISHDRKSIRSASLMPGIAVLTNFSFGKKADLPLESWIMFGEIVCRISPWSGGAANNAGIEVFRRAEDFYFQAGDGGLRPLLQSGESKDLRRATLQSLKRALGSSDPTTYIGRETIGTIMDTTRITARRRLGRSDLLVTPIGLGCMSLSGVYGDADDATSEALIHHALDRGANHLDSADVYGMGHNEGVVGRAIKSRRGEVVLATKFGNIRRDGKPAADGRPEYVQQACEASLARLCVEVIDLYYQHRVDPAVPIEETVGAMARLVEQGKVRYLGLSEARPETIRRAHAVHPITAVQTEFSLLYRSEADETRKVTRELGIGYVAYSPLGRGLLTGTIHTPDDVDGRRATHPRFQGDNFTHNRALVAVIEALAAKNGCTLTCQRVGRANWERLDRVLLARVPFKKSVPPVLVITLRTAPNCAGVAALARCSAAPAPRLMAVEVRDQPPAG